MASERLVSSSSKAPFYADNSTLSLLPTARAARSSVDSVIEGFAGSSSHSTASVAASMDAPITMRGRRPFPYS